MRSYRKSLELSELETCVYARRAAGASFAELGRELGLSGSYVSGLYGVAVRKVTAQRLREAGRKRIDFLNRK